MRSTFQIIVLGFFGTFLVIGLIVLSLTKGGSQANVVPITVWGTVKQSDWNSLASDINKKDKTFIINYVEKRPESFDEDFVTALADGKGPDVVLLPEDIVFKHRNRLAPIPYGSFSARSFRDTFVQEAELYLDGNGILAMPFAIDPLVMYWNRDIFNSAGIAAPPRYWSELPSLAIQLSKRDSSFNITQSAVALGEFRNISNAKEILSALILQLGNPIVSVSTSGLVGTLSLGSAPAASAVNFFTEFANPAKPDYSWNRSLPNSSNLFLANQLALYFGFASELPAIRQKNPNLNFDVSYFPQLKDAKVVSTFGRIYGLSVVRGSPRSQIAFNRISTLVSAGNMAKWSALTGLPPVRRDLLSATPSDPYQSIFYVSALRARAWLDPSAKDSNALFQNMIESITSGEVDAESAVRNAAQELNALLQ